MSGDAPKPSDETLLGYLIGGLSDDENARIELMLEHDASLRQRLRDLRSMLEPLASGLGAEGFGTEDSSTEDSSTEKVSAESNNTEDINTEFIGTEDSAYEPRAGLVSDTMSLIIEQESSKGQRPVGFGGASNLDWSDAPIGTRLAWLDSLVALAAGIIFLSFLLPTIWRWRESARQISCAENLRNLGVALTGFTDFSPQHRFPAINTSGPLTFAGVYAIRLQDASLLDSSKWLHCPSNDYIDFPMPVPTSAEFLAAAPDQQRIWRYVAGGNYAYNLGNLVDGKYEAPRSDSPVRVALVGDMWPKTLGAIENVGSPIVLHGDRGANILYSDGSTQWIRIPEQVQGLAVDHPFLNADLEQGVGRGLKDACLAPSYWLPAADLPGRELKPVEIDRNK